nr:1151_t:CDS:2 [Entrophospora candida]
MGNGESNLRNSIQTDSIVPNEESSEDENSEDENDDVDESANKKLCLGCLEAKNIKKLKTSTGNCKHEQDICKKCFISHIKAKLDAYINCPTLNCRERIFPNDVKRFGSNNKLYKRLDNLMLRQSLNNSAEFRWCKSPGCGSGQIHEGGADVQIMKCHACGSKSCYTHDVPWHGGLTCEKYDELRKVEEAATDDYLQQETKPCPKCGIRIVKNGGCNHITCKIVTCRYEFCWLCFADYKEILKKGNKIHKPTCQFYA